MLLCKDENEFRDLIALTAEYTKYEPSLICKDYYVMLLLKEIIKAEPDLIFKGGTSLSKA